MPNGLPQLPDPTKIVDSGAEIAKATVTHGASVGLTIADAFRKMVMDTAKGTTVTVDRTVKDVVALIEANLNTGKSTVEQVLRELETAADNVRNQVDRGFGDEVVRKIKREIENIVR